MLRIAQNVSCVVIVVLIVLSTAAARAEGFIDLRAGAAFTENSDVEIFGFRLKTEHEDSATAGLRAGYWFDSLPWLGLAADVSYFAPDDSGGPSIDVIPISPLLMLRAPLAVSEEFPNGRLQPFAGIGPGVFVSLVDFGVSGQEDESVDVGVDVHAGLRFLIARNASIFLQYRYTWFEPTKIEIFGRDYDPELSTHHVAGGIGLHF